MNFLEDRIEMLLSGDCDAAFLVRGNCRNRIPFIIRRRAGRRDRRLRPSEEGHVGSATAGVGRAQIADFYRSGSRLAFNS